MFQSSSLDNIYLYSHIGMRLHDVTYLYLIIRFINYSIYIQFLAFIRTIFLNVYLFYSLSTYASCTCLKPHLVVIVFLLSLMTIFGLYIE